MTGPPVPSIYSLVMVTLPILSSLGISYIISSINSSIIARSALPVGVMMNGLARFGVPLFFMVSGYFSYGKGTDTVKRRIWKVFGLFLGANGIYFVWRLLVLLPVHPVSPDKKGKARQPEIPHIQKGNPLPQNSCMEASGALGTGQLDFGVGGRFFCPEVSASLGALE